jgi:hypothetical protein
MEAVNVMNLIQRKPKPRPYAANSTGRSRGALSLGSRIGRVQIYEAIGDAREIFVDKLSQAIVTYLNDNSEKLQESASFVDLSLFMMGKSPDRTKPIVMFVSDDKQVRKEAFRLIKESGILKEYPGFGLGEMPLKAEFENLQPLGSQNNAVTLGTPGQSGILQNFLGFGLMERATGAEPVVIQPLGYQPMSTGHGAPPAPSMSSSASGQPVEVLTMRTGSLCGLRLKAKIRNGSTIKTNLAAAGGVVKYKNYYFLHSVDHFLQPAETRQEVGMGWQSIAPEQDECEVIGLSDDEDDDDWLVGATSHGSATPSLSDSESTYGSLVDTEIQDGSASPAGSPAVQDAPAPTVTVPPETFGSPELIAPSSSGCSAQAGQAAMRSALLDSAFIHVNATETSAVGFGTLQLRNAAIPLESYQEHVETTPSDAIIQTTTPDGPIAGTLSGTPSFVRLPGSRIFQEVYVAMLARPLSPGDCGSWVKHASTGKLFGHVVAGSPTTGLVFLIPAAKTFAEALKTFSAQDELNRPGVFSPHHFSWSTYTFPGALDETEPSWTWRPTKPSGADEQWLPTSDFSQMLSFQQSHAASAAQQRPGSVLWCEFSELMSCHATFSADDEAGWIEHHANHLHNVFPDRLSCWFCDYPRFMAQHAPDHRTNFEARMQHIRRHILTEHLTPEHMRPDFSVVAHLHDLGLINDFMFHHAMGYNEFPDTFRLPGTDAHSSSSAGPHGQWQPRGVTAGGQYHDLDRERRAERRRQRGKQLHRR